MPKLYTDDRLTLEFWCLEDDVARIILSPIVLSQTMQHAVYSSPVIPYLSTTYTTLLVLLF